MKIVFVLFALLLSVGVATAQDAPTSMKEAITNDIENFNTVTQSLSTSSIAQSFIFPSIFDVDVESGLPAPTGLTSWTISDDGLTYTFTIRADANWSDGTPISAHDVKFTFDAIAQDTVETFRKSFIESISAVNVIDDKTFEIVLMDATCNLWGNISTLIMPAHKFAADFSDFTSSAFNVAPDISGGPFLFDEWAPDEFIRFTANPTYWKGEPNIDTYVLQVIPDSAVVTQALLSGEVDFVRNLSADSIEQLETVPNVAVHPLKMNSFQYLILNHADPNNPMSAYDADGNLVEQAPNPFFSDVRVRQAIAMGWDKDAALVLKPEGVSRLSSPIPASVTWAFNNDITPWAYDPEAAAALLDEAGWVLNDAGVREKDGVPFAFSLAYISGGSTDDVAQLIEDQLGQLGIQVSLIGMEAGALVSERAFPQVFDAVILNLTWDTPEPQVLTDLILNSHQDIAGGGFNFASYVNPEMDALLAQAGSGVDCSADTRAPFYYQIQEITRDEVVYDFISDTVGYVGISTRIQNFETANWGFSEIQTWSASE